ncbi:MAG: hypothetical protein ACO1RX_12290 [Candidatus Sericytochromatia bacterium]
MAPLKRQRLRQAALAPLLETLLPRLIPPEQAAFESLLSSLDAQGLFPAQGPYTLVASAWLALAERLPSARNGELLPLLRALTNALCHLLETPEAQAGPWLADWLQGSELCPDTPSWLDWGKVLAWRWGLATLRPQALEIAHSWPEPLQRRALQGYSAAELRANPWLPGVAGLCRQRVLGGLRSWGGQLWSPPQVAWAEDDTLWVQDSLQLWQVHLDAWGVHWQKRAAQALPPNPLHPHIECGSLRLPDDAIQVSNRHSLAVTRPCSLEIWIFGHGEPPRENAILADTNLNA